MDTAEYLDELFGDIAEACDKRWMQFEWIQDMLTARKALGWDQ